jgi:hypothetical protein
MHYFEIDFDDSRESPSGQNTMIEVAQYTSMANDEVDTDAAISHQSPLMILIMSSFALASSTS